MTLDEGKICFLLDHPESSGGGDPVRTYVLTEAVPFHIEYVARIALAVAAAKLDIDPPQMVWFDDAPMRDIEQLRLDELPVFQHAPIAGVAFAPVNLIAVNARQSAQDLIETVAHETYHIARPGDEPPAVVYGQYIKEALMSLIRFIDRPYAQAA